MYPKPFIEPFFHRKLGCKDKINRYEAGFRFSLGIGICR